MRANPEAQRFVICTTSLALAILLPLCVGMGSPGVSGLLIIVGIAGSVVALGRAFSLVLRWPLDFPGTVAIEAVAGAAVFSVLGFLLMVTAELSMGALLALVAFTSATFYGIAWSSRVIVPAAKTLRPTLIDAAALILGSALSTLWNRELLGSLETMAQTGIFQGWRDFFLHATEITYLKNHAALLGQSVYLSGAPQIFYHRCSYVIAAVVSGSLGMSSMAAACVVWSSLGLILMAAGAYGLGATLAGRRAGLFAMVTLFVLPDSSTYWLQNGFFSFHWLVLIAPGSGYGIALILAALAFFVAGRQKKCAFLQLTGLFFAGLSLLFKAQTAIPGTILMAVLLFASWQPVRRGQRWAACGVILVLGAGAIWACEQIPLAPHFITGRHDVLGFFSIVHAMGPSRYSEWFSQWRLHAGGLTQGVAGTGLLLVAAFGALVPTLIAALIWRGNKSWAWPFRAIPAASLAAYFAVVYFVPQAAGGDVTEFGHRSFVLVYAIFVVALIAHLSSIFQEFAPRNQRTHFATWLLAVFAVVAGLGYVWRASEHAQRSTLAWGPDFTRTPVSVDLQNAANFIRRKARPDESVVTANGDPKAIIAALTERAAFLSRVSIYNAGGTALEQLARTRGEALDELREAKKLADLAAWAERQNRRWLLVQKSDVPLWPEALFAASAFRAGEICVYDLRSAGG